MLPPYLHLLHESPPKHAEVKIPFQMTSVRRFLHGTTVSDGHASRSDTPEVNHGLHAACWESMILCLGLP